MTSPKPGPSLRKEVEKGPRIGTGYQAVALFAVVFAALLWLRATLPKGTFDGVEWLVLLALIAALPLLLNYVRPLLGGLEVGALLKLTFREVNEVEAASAGLKELEESLAGLNPTQMQAPQYASAMTSFASVIVDRVKEIATLGSEVTLVDLGAGNRWVWANLYFLALLLEHRTQVRQLVLVEVRDGREDVFVGMCSPQELRAHLTMVLPHLSRATEATDSRFGKLDNDLGMQFFQALTGMIANDPHADEYKRWVMSSSLRPIMGTSLNSAALEWMGQLSRDDYRTLLEGEQPYLAAIRDEQFAFVFDQRRVALPIARKAARGMAG